MKRKRSGIFRAAAVSTLAAIMMLGGTLAAFGAEVPAAEEGGESAAAYVGAAQESLETEADGGARVDLPGIVIGEKEDVSSPEVDTQAEPESAAVPEEKEIQQTAAADGVVRFGVISDTHVTATKTVQQQRLAKAFEFFSGNSAKTPIDPVDKMVVVGDLTDNGTSSEMNTWKSIKDATLFVPLQAGMGNHENNRWAEYEGATGNKANYVTELNGYTFITISPGSGSINPETGRATGTGTGGYAYAVPWLEEQLAAAEAKSPDKPIFVFFHHPIKGTFYVSNEWNGSGLDNVFKTHPRAVTFAGHIHSPNNISTSIWQDGGYTAVNTVSTSYFELERGMIYGSVPPNASQCAQGLLVEASGSQVTIKNYDILTDQWINQTWTFDVGPETRLMPYTNENLSAKAAAPVFREGAQLTINDQKKAANGVTATIVFDQAVIPASHEETMGDIVHSYRYDFYNKKNDQLDLSFTSWSDYYITPMPEKYTLPMDVQNSQGKYLKEGTDYILKITAIDAFGKESATPLQTEFRTIGSFSEKENTEMNFALKLDGNLNNANFFPNVVTMAKGSASYVDGVNGKAIHLDSDNFLRLEAADKGILDYNQSFTLAYQMKLTRAAADDPIVISNKNWASGANDGWNINVKEGRLKLNWTPVNGVRHDSWIDPRSKTTLNEWVHVAVTFDKETDTVSIYFNGKLVEAITNAKLSGGIKGDGNETLIGNSYNTSSSYPKPYYNQTGNAKFDIAFDLDDFVLVNEVYSADKIAELSEGGNPSRPLIRLSGAFPETVYKDEALRLPEVSLNSADAKLLASISIGGSELFSTPESLDKLDLNALITPELLQSLVPGSYEITIKAHSAISKLLVLETRTITVNVAETKAVPSTKTGVTFTGSARITEKDPANYVLGLSNIKNASIIQAEFAYDANLKPVGATALSSDFVVVGEPVAANGKAKVTLMASGNGVNVAEAAEVLKLTFEPLAQGSASVTLTKLTAISNEAEDGIPNQVINETDLAADGIRVDTEVSPWYDPCDFNRDGAVDLKDLAFAQYYYAVSEGDPGWAVAFERGVDVNGDGTVDIADIILILSYIENR